MKLTENFQKFIMASILLVSVFSPVFSQVTINDAIMAYNSGLNAVKAENYDSALIYLTNASNLAKELGEEGDEVAMNVEMQLPGIYYQYATKLYNDKKIDEAIEKYNTTIELAVKASDAGLEQKAKSAISQLYYFKGATSFQNEQFEEAKGFFNKSIEFLANNTKAYYMIAAVYKSLNDDENLVVAAKKSAEIAKANNDNKYFENSLKLAGDYFLKKGLNSNKSKKYSEAVGYLNTSLEFNENDPKALFLLTQVYNGLSKWDNAIETGNKTLQYEKDTPEDKAKIYYELGTAYKSKGDVANACDAYKKAAFGPYKESAEYIVKNDLKCQ